MTSRGVTDDHSFPRTFEGWYAEAYQPSLRALLVVCGGDLARAEDVVSEAFSRALERWDSVSVMESPDAWLVRVAMNLEKRRLRRKAQESTLVAMSEPTTVSQPILPNESLWNMVQSLSLRQRRAIVLRYVEDQTQAEVARRMKVAPGTTAATLNQARSQLKTRLEEKDFNEQQS